MAWLGQSPSALQSGKPRVQLPGSLQSGKPGQPPMLWQSVARSCTRLASLAAHEPSAVIGVTGVLAAQRQHAGLPLSSVVLMRIMCVLRDDGRQSGWEGGGWGGVGRGQSFTRSSY